MFDSMNGSKNPSSYSQLS